ncbi:SufD family Fe-S cluster assembly protein [Candidatus Bathyarchaeota archaeon]|nr:MAG: SufD family Fe-S cluster assembly protein [Candidatus Bathyarchaeota archaeon]
MPKSHKGSSKMKSKPDKSRSDLDVNSYTRKPKRWGSRSIAHLPEEFLKRASEVGIVSEENSRSATYFQVDHSVTAEIVQNLFQDKIEVMSTKKALKKYRWFKDYWWKLINADTDKFTALAETRWDQGYFIRILEDQKVDFPLQACLFVSTDNLNQNVHNVVISEPGSEAQIITGCTVHPSVHRGLHVGVSEFYIKEDANLTFTMIHGWSQEFDSRPRSAAVIGDNGVFVSNYMCFKPVKSLQMYPVAYCRGVNSRVSFNNILYASEASYIDAGAKIVLQNEGSGGEIITRAIATDKAKVYARGFLQGEHGGSKAHLECRGLLLSDEAEIYAVPELLATSQGAELSHEAAVGKIAEEQIQYLMSRGFSEDEASSLIVRGFMDVSIFGLPKDLENSIKQMVDITAQRAL